MYGLSIRPRSDLVLDGFDDASERLTGWISEHAPEFGLPEDLAGDELEFMEMETPNVRDGGLRIQRFRQTYRGLPILGPDAVLTVVSNDAAVISIAGRPVDPIVDYQDLQGHAPESTAQYSILRHASAKFEISADALRLHGLGRFADIRTQRVVWRATVVHESRALADFVVAGKDLGANGLLSLLHVGGQASAGLLDTEQVGVLAEDPAAPTPTDTFDVADAVELDTLSSGEPLLGSVYDPEATIQLATTDTVIYDFNGSISAAQATRIKNVNGEFLDDQNPNRMIQHQYRLLQSAHDAVERRVTIPVLGQERKLWDSGLPSSGSNSDYAPGTFSPRWVFMGNSTTEGACPDIANGCFLRMIEVEQNPPLPEILQLPFAGATIEWVGGINVGDGNSTTNTVLTHEFGHLVDFFQGSGIIDSPPCMQPCQPSCMFDTSDEAGALAESVANMGGILLMADLFESVHFDRCDVITEMQRGSGGHAENSPGHNCMQPGEFINRYELPATCTAAEEYCDGLDEPDEGWECCNPTTDVDCTQPAPSCGTCCDPAVDTDCVAPDNQCPSGFAHPSFIKSVPTGACTVNYGYNVGSVLQAFWQLIHGQVCEPTAPFSCREFDWPPGTEPRDAAGKAFLYALRTQPLTYRQLFDSMATYIACAYGPVAYGDANEIFCNHGLATCGAPTPTTCCGNDVIEPPEECDGTDIVGPNCEELGYAGGQVSCTAECTIDESACVTETGTGSTSDSATSASATSESNSNSGGSNEDDTGCGCRSTDPAIPGWITLLCLIPWCRRADA